MELTLYALLNNNTELNNLIGENNIFPVFCTNLGRKASLEYEYSLVKSGLVNQSRFAINIISKNYDFIIDVQQLLNKILVNKLDTEFNVADNYKFNIRLGGGSSPLYRPDLKIYEVNLIYIVKWLEVEIKE
ncbi:MAG: hypothetical protein ACRCX8_19570 [Sarcina sp.]